MKKKIFFIVDIFCPRPFYDVSKISNDDFYIIFNAFLIEDFSGEPHPTLEEYIKNPALDQYEFKYLFQNAEAFTVAQEYPDRVIPIPLPSDTELSFSFNGIQITNGRGYSFSDDKIKLEWLTRNFGSLQLILPRDLNYINLPQFQDYNGWLIALLTDVVKRKDSSILSEIEKKILVFANSIPPGLDGGFSETVRNDEKEAANANDFPFVKESFYFYKYCVTIIPHISDADKAKYLPAPVKFTPAALKALLNNITDIRMRVGSEKNYRNIFLNEIKDSLGLTPTVEEIQKVKEILRLFFGAGERLRIPSLPGFGLMLIKDIDNPDGKDSGWFVTNNSSLMGQVAAIPLSAIVNLKLDTPVTITVNQEPTPVFNSVICDNNTLDFQKSIIAYIENIRDNDHSKFKQTLRLPELPVTDPNPLAKRKLDAQRTDYAPVNTLILSEAQPISLVYEANPADYYYSKIPESIFDVLSGAPKIKFENSGISGKAGKFIEFIPQRILLKRNDLFKDGILIKPAIQNSKSLEDSFALNDFIPGIIFSVQITKVVLPGKEEFLYKISRKAALADNIETPDPHLKTIIEEIKGFKSLLYNNQTTPDKNRISVFLQLAKGSDLKILNLTDWLNDGKIDADELIELYSADKDIKPYFEAEKEKISGMIILLPADNNEVNRNEFWQKGFNSLLRKEKSAWHLALEKQYQFKFCTSVNGYSRSTSLHLDFTNFISSSTTPVDSVNPLIMDYTNFNKFRLFATSTTDASNKIYLHEADASLPLIEKFDNEKLENPSFYYKIMHRFSETVKNNEDSWQNENERYQLYISNASANKFLLKARLENQYAYRLEATGPEIEFSYSNPIRNISDLVSQKKDNDKLEVNALLFFAYQNKSIELTLNKEYLAALFEKNNTNLTGYRELYEAFNDAVFNDQCKLIIERWEFDNSSGQIDTNVSAHPEVSKEWPSILPYLSFKGLTKLDVNDKFFELLNTKIRFLDAKIFASSEVDEPTFKNLVDDYIAGSRNLKVTIDLGEDESIKIDSSHLIRAALYINRTPARTVNSQFTTPIGKEAISAFRLEGEDFLSSEILPCFDHPNASLDALQEFLKVHTENNLYHSFSFITAKNVPENPPPANVKELLGETSSYVFKPPAKKPAKTDTLLYFVPYAFKPLKVHTDLEDLTTTNTFIAYLLRILNYLAYPERMKEDPLAFLVNISDPSISRQQLFNFRLKVRDQILPSVAEQLAGTIDFVDNRPGTIENNADNWNYRNVIQLTEAITFEKIKQAVGSVLRDNPLQYIEAKAFGLGLFSTYAHDANFENPKAGSTSDLFSLQLIKEIRPVINKEGNLDPTDKTKIQFKNLLRTMPGQPPAFLEILEDSLYDNEFQIQDNRLSTTKSLMIRTAEDILENINPFDNQNNNPAPSRLAHFCPDWKFETSDETKEYYLLPSRKPPTIPVSFIPSTGKDAREPAYFIKKKSDDLQDWKQVLEAQKEVSVDFGNNNTVTFSDPKRALLNDDFLTKPPPGDWKRWDVYINTYDFIVDSDEENDFENDLFEIAVEKVKKSDKANLADLEEMNDDGYKKIFEYDLFRHFDYYARRNIKAGVPSPLTFKNIIEGETGNAEKQKGIGQLLEDLIKTGNIPDTSSTNFTLKFSGTENGPNARWILQGGHTEPGLIGKIIAVHIYSSQTGNKKQLLRCSVMAEAWTHFRCRLRVRRNMRDFNGDNKFDINPAFVMNSPWSPWLDYGIQELSYDYIDEPQVSSNWSEFVKYLPVPTTVMKIDDFIKKIRNKDPIRLGDLIKNFIKQNEALVNKNEIFNSVRLISGFIAEINNNTGLQLFHSSKQVNEVLKLSRMKTDIIGKAGITSVSVEKIDDIINPLPSNLRSHEPVFYIKWYSTEDTSRVVFAVAWKLKFEFF